AGESDAAERPDRPPLEAEEKAVADPDLAETAAAPSFSPPSHRRIRSGRPRLPREMLAAAKASNIAPEAAFLPDQPPLAPPPSLLEYPGDELATAALDDSIPNHAIAPHAQTAGDTPPVRPEEPAAEALVTASDAQPTPWVEIMQPVETDAATPGVGAISAEPSETTIESTVSKTSENLSVELEKPTTEADHVAADPAVLADSAGAAGASITDEAATETTAREQPAVSEAAAAEPAPDSAQAGRDEKYAPESEPAIKPAS
ncbi:MAG: hypothetical protein WBQ93_07015, partial [Candidatus Competibacter sp.]